MNLAPTTKIIPYDAYRDNFPLFSEMCLKIRLKTGLLAPFSLNRAQQYIHDKVCAQRIAHGKVRAIVLKGRQQGCSTYIEGRLFHQTISQSGMRTFILTHDTEATKNLFEMASRFYENTPDKFKPALGESSAKGLGFPNLDSDYRIGTAGNKAVGRSQTVQLFHGCLGVDTLVVMSDGHLKRIGDIEIGENCVTHTGKIAPVTFKSRQTKPVNRVIMRGLTHFPFTATDEHRFWTMVGWKRLDELRVGDKVGYPVREIVLRHHTISHRINVKPRHQGGGTIPLLEIELPLDYEFGRIVGLYLAEGSIKKNRGCAPSAVTFAVHEREVARTVDWLLKVKDIITSVGIERRINTKTCVVVVYGRCLAEMIEKLCGRKDNKRVDNIVFEAGEGFARGVLHGYLSGDGHSQPVRDRRIRATSIRPRITVAMRDIAASLGYGWATIEHKAAAIRHGRNEQEAFIFALCGMGVDKLAPEMGFKSPERKRTSNKYGEVIVSGGYAWIPIKSIESIGEQEVCDLEIGDNDHSYCILNGATHNSEVAFWPNASEHALGILQAIADEPGTEVWLESTANGRGNYFHEMWKKAEMGESDFIPIFIPWHWQDEYVGAWDKSWSMDDAEKEYYKSGISHKHLAWRRKKIAEMDSGGRRGIDAFKQEYPATSEEAFDVAQGKAFEKLTRQRHLLRNFVPPQHFTKIMVIDWGTAKPFAVGWFCVCDEDMTLKAKEHWPERFIPKDSIIMYREWYGWNGRPDEGCRMESFEVARKIIDIEKEAQETIDYRIGDSAMWNQVDGPSVEERMYEATGGKLMMVRSRKDRIQNYQEMRARINGTDGIPQFYATEQCRHFWRTVPELMLDEHHPEKGHDTKADDHIADTCLYICADRPVGLSERDRHDEKIRQWEDGDEMNDD